MQPSPPAPPFAQPASPPPLAAHDTPLTPEQGAAAVQSFATLMRTVERIADHLGDAVGHFEETVPGLLDRRVFRAAVVYYAHAVPAGANVYLSCRDSLPAGWYRVAAAEALGDGRVALFVTPIYSPSVAPDQYVVAAEEPVIVYRRSVAA